jgi:hypothetical protein
MRVVPAKNSTLVRVPPPTAAAEAVNVMGMPTLAVAPANGEVSATAGAATETFTAVDVAVALFESVTRAVSTTGPAAVGVQFAV